MLEFWMSDYLKLKHRANETRSKKTRINERYTEIKMLEWFDLVSVFSIVEITIKTFREIQKTSTEIENAAVYRTF